MKQAEETGEISEVGVLYLESKKLHSELSKLQSESPPANDLVEVRESMRLPMGFVTIDGKIYYLMDGQADTYQRQALVTQMHPLGVMQPPPFAAEVIDKIAAERSERLAAERLASEKLVTERLIAERFFSGIGSSILTSPKHKQDLVALFAPAELPKLTLLWSGARDGFSADAFHSRCDNKGATLTVIRSGEYIFGGFNSASWTSSDSWTGQPGCWLYSLSSPTGLLTKLQRRNDGYAFYIDAQWGPTFGGGHDLHISSDMQSANNNHSRPTSYEVAPGFAGTVFTSETLAGKEKFAVDAIEVFRCR